MKMALIRNAANKATGVTGVISKAFMQLGAPLYVLEPTGVLQGISHLDHRESRQILNIPMACRHRAHLSMIDGKSISPPHARRRLKNLADYATSLDVNDAMMWPIYKQVYRNHLLVRERLVGDKVHALHSVNIVRLAHLALA